MSQALDPVALTGKVWLRPGAALPGIRSTRPNLAPRLADGRAACDIPDLLASLFSLCGHAHRFTARRALAAARGRPDDVRPDEMRTLHACTARDQVQRIAHDWPRLLPRIGAAPEGIERHGRRFQGPVSGTAPCQCGWLQKPGSSAMHWASQGMLCSGEASR